MPYFFRMGLKWEAVAAPASLGGKGFMVERISARQSATFLFGAHARAGVWPAENREEVSYSAPQEPLSALLVLFHKSMVIPAYPPHLQP